MLYLPYKVNVSSINDFMTCRFRWWAKWVMNWVPKYEAPALTFGKLVHEVFEEKEKSKDIVDSMNKIHDKWEAASNSTTDPVERDCGFKALHQLDEISEALVEWTDQYPIVETLEVEQPFEFTDKEFGDIIYLGRPDRVSLINDTIWHVQTKALAPATNFGVFIELAKRSYHEHLYAEVLSKKYENYMLAHIQCTFTEPCEATLVHYKYGGTLFNLIRKLKYRTKVTKNKPLGETKELSEMFWQHPMSINLQSPLHKNIMNCIREYAFAMRATEKDYNQYNLIPIPNERMNGGYYGNKPDEYFRVLVGEIELGDERYFKKRENQYASASDTEDQGT